nr:MAG TPA: hypothetical protein [Caudoviricetes sp.]
MNPLLTGPQSGCMITAYLERMHFGKMPLSD